MNGDLGRWISSMLAWLSQVPFPVMPNFSFCFYHPAISQPSQISPPCLDQEFRDMGWCYNLCHTNFIENILSIRRKAVTPRIDSVSCLLNRVSDVVIHWTVNTWALSILLSPRPSNSLVTLTAADLLVSLFMILSPFFFLLNPSYGNHMVSCPKHCDTIRKCVVCVV